MPLISLGTSVHKFTLAYANRDNWKRSLIFSLGLFLEYQSLLSNKVVKWGVTVIPQRVELPIYFLRDRINNLVYIFYANPKCPLKGKMSNPKFRQVSNFNASSLCS